MPKTPFFFFTVMYRSISANNTHAQTPSLSHTRRQEVVELVCQTRFLAHSYAPDTTQRTAVVKLVRFDCIADILRYIYVTSFCFTLHPVGPRDAILPLPGVINPGGALLALHHP